MPDAPLPMVDAVWRVRRRMLRPKLGGALLASLEPSLDASGSRKRFPFHAVADITGPSAVIARYRLEAYATLAAILFEGLCGRAAPDAPERVDDQRRCTRSNRPPYRSDTGQSKAFPVLASRGSNRAQESAAHQFPTAKPAGKGNFFDTLPRFLKQTARRFNTKLLDIMSRGSAEFRSKDPRKS